MINKVYRKRAAVLAAALTIYNRINLYQKISIVNESGQIAVKIFINACFKRFVGAMLLLPLNSSGRLSSDVIHNSVDALDLVNNSVGSGGKDIIGNA